MASRWRIRHKLTLGLGLVVGVMALLLGGTLRGLWSYYVTMNGIRHSLTGLRKAEEYRKAVEQLASPEREARQRRGGPDAEAPLPDRIRKAAILLGEYEKELQNTLSQGHNPGRGEYQQTLAGTLHEMLDALIDAEKKGAGQQPVILNTGDEGPRPDGGDRVAEKIAHLKRTSDDLIGSINADLNGHINESRSHYQVTLWISLPTSIVGLLVVTSLLRSFYAWVFYPIRDLEAGVQRVARGDLAHRIEVHSGDEMEELGAAFNDMMGRLQYLYSDLARQVNERSRQLVRSERLASVGFLAAGVAHEINNPLASIAFCSEALDARLAALLARVQTGDPGGDDLEVFGKYLKMIQEEAFRCKNITEKLLAFSRTGERRREPIDLRELVQSVLDVTQHLQNHRGKHIAFEVRADRAPGGRITAWVNGEEIKSVVLNLVVNALDSMDEGGRLTIRLGQQGDMAEMQFADSGCGMTQEVLENIFEPFFTRSRTGKGTGLGLTISHRIIIQHGGEIEAASSGPGQGSTFTVRLPVRPQEQSTAPEPDGRPALPQRKAA